MSERRRPGTSQRKPPDPHGSVILKTATDPAPLVQAIREEITSIDTDQPVMQVRTMTDVVDSQVATFSAMRGLLVIFGALALVLATIGIYGVHVLLGGPEGYARSAYTSHSALMWDRYGV